MGRGLRGGADGGDVKTDSGRSVSLNLGIEMEVDFNNFDIRAQSLNFYLGLNLLVLGLLPKTWARLFTHIFF